MKKINIVKENRDYNRIIEKNKPFRYKDYIIYIDKRESSIYKFGFSVGKKIGNAVVRNKVKRQVRSLIDSHKNLFANGKNYIIMIRKGVKKLTYAKMEQDLVKLLQKGTLDEKN